MPNSYITIEQLSQMLQIGRSTIDRWRKQGMPYIKIGKGIRFEEDTVMKWIKENKSE